MNNSTAIFFHQTNYRNELGFLLSQKLKLFFVIIKTKIKF
jgi:hypothetical protein